MISTFYVNLASIYHFFYFFFIWNLFISICHSKLLKDFNFAFLVNSCFICVFFLIQSYIYPDAYGTTSPIGRAWTDDSYFFALAADSIPENLFLRDNYFLYEHFFSSFVKNLTPFYISHPLDVVFFQSGSIGVLAAFTKEFSNSKCQDTRVGSFAYYLIILCPFLMMNGGVIFIRDTLIAAMLIYFIYCIDNKKYLFAIIAIIFQFALRPGTALATIVAGLVINWHQFIKTITKYKYFASFIFLTILALVYSLFNSFDKVIELYLSGTSEGGAISIVGRSLLNNLLIASSDSNQYFLQIQQLPFIAKSIFSGSYIFLYPFLNFEEAFGNTIDVRAFLMNLIIPIQLFWLNSWFFAAIFTKEKHFKGINKIIISIAIILMIIGLYSLQTRHKTFIYPLYYMAVSYGFIYGDSKSKIIGYSLSGFLLLIQVLANFRGAIL